ncbi:phospho-sugar mutase [Lacticigenium naphthae]|uniref:phospho-sugar mutase n=1 Tax=Lacticigenium naphthae TaxID=515351 RepID=UPI00041F6307|nr:phospho-sugar mutase [Lacticigenium naphthae]
MDWEKTYTEWRNFEGLDEALKKDLRNHENDKQSLEDAFYAPLEFGTAGMRGVLGAGINRMNIYTIRQATEGLALFIDSLNEDAKQKGVAIAYDCRHQSPEFSMEAAKTLGHHGIKAYVFESLRPTPELSFAVRHLNAAAGIMITASHNPPEYNGYKVYGEDGGQMPPKEAEALTDFVRKIDNPLTVGVDSETELKEKGLLEIIGEDVDQAYLEEMRTVTIDSELISRMQDELKIVFTPLHGTGKMIGERALKNAGFNQVYLVPEQAEPDADFSTVKSPNPEDPQAFEYAIRLGKEIDADILIATDPDADRLGLAVRTAKGHYEVLNGNQIASLLLNYILTALDKEKMVPKNARVVKSIVSSELPTAIAEKHGARMVNVLTGFKFIAEKIKEYETDPTNDFIFGFEESYGYLIKPFVRDKDAMQALVLVSEMAAYYKELGESCFDVLQDLYQEHGHFVEKTISVTMAGMDGAKQIDSLMRELRENTPQAFGGVKIATVEDYQAQTHKSKVTGQETAIDMPPANVLKYFLSDNSWIAIRPSGTEPKIKFYIGAYAASALEITEKIRLFEKDIQEIVPK